MSQMMPQLPNDPAQLQAILAQLGGSGGGADMQGQPAGLDPASADQPTGPNDNWLVDAINAVHDGMVLEGDPKQVSLLGAILNQLTTFQANSHGAAQQGQQQGP